jgi:hypothetical protein
VTNDNDGIYDGLNLADKTFYGFKMDLETGRTTVEVINDDTMVISYPDPDVVKFDDVLHYFWSRDAIRFEWGPDGHLHMVFL